MQDTDYGLDEGESFEPDDLEDIEEVPTDQPHVMTVLGPILPGDLGVTLPHVHLLCDPLREGPPDNDNVLDRVDLMLEEIAAFVSFNGRSLVDCSTRDYGRNAPGLLQIASYAPVNIIAVTGRHKHEHAQHAPHAGDADALTAEFVADLTAGMDDTNAMAGVIKVAGSLDHLTSDERVAVEAGGRAQMATGRPITTHLEQGTGADEIMELLSEQGVRPDRVILGHVDNGAPADIDAIEELAKSGAFVQIDQIGKVRVRDDAGRIALLLRLLEHGLEDHILLSLDYARKHLFPAYGGAPGLTFLQERFLLEFLHAGGTAELARKMLVDNPARALVTIPPASNG